MKIICGSFYVLCCGLLLLSGCGQPQPEVSQTDSEGLHPLSIASALDSDLPVPGRVAVLGEGAKDENGVADDFNENTEAAVQWLDRQAEIQRMQLNEAREALLAFQRERPMQILLQRIEADATSLTDLNRSFHEIKVEILRTETRLEALAEDPDADSQVLERELEMLLEVLKGQRDAVGEELESLKHRLRAQHLELAENERELQKLKRNLSVAEAALQSVLKRIEEARRSAENDVAQ
ncbi:MAG: hypothetical protein JJU29_06315 [Verrucomicrobia bacterium]|nr:hypothetical protein [Verrucomicrobiota bacterium]MCH8511481.1 hypothetical protein [Kiritimatiellia bacterium]